MKFGRRKKNNGLAKGEESKPAIAIIGTRGLPATYGGFETSAEKTSSRWVRDGYDVVAYCRASHYQEQRASHLGVRLRYVPCLDRGGLGTPTAALYSVLHLLFVERSTKYVHLYNNINAVFVPLLRLCGKTVLISADGIEWKRAKWGRLQRWGHQFGELCATRFGATVIADNEAVAAYYRERHNVEPTVIAYGADSLGRDPDLAKQVLDTHDLVSDNYFIFVGRIVKEKGVDNLIDAYESLDTDKPLVIVGDAEPSEYRDAIFARASDRVRFVGYQYDTAYEQLLANASMYISASDLEGTSPSLLAAMAAGICSLVQGIPENEATAGDSIELYEVGNVGDLAQRWQRLADNPAQADAIRAKGLAHIEKFYQWDAIANAYLKAWIALERKGRSSGLTIDLRTPSARRLRKSNTDESLNSGPGSR